MLDDQQLLRRYATEGSEAAFSELVARYVDLVYSAALRRTGGDSHLAQDVAQLVFTDLAHKARSLPRGVILAGWLHRASRFAAAQLIRTEQRRHRREQEAATMNSSESSPDWEQVRPLVDDALDTLSRLDRDAVVLRFMEQRSLAEVGRALGLNEDTARKRVSRALEKLRAQLARRGMTTSAGALAAAITANAVQGAPAGLTAALASTSLAAASVASGSGITILKLMTTTKLKIGVAGALLVAGILLVMRSQRDEAYPAGPNDSAASSMGESAADTAAARRSRGSMADRLSRSEQDTAAAQTPEQIVAARLAQFGRSRRELLHSLAGRHGIAVPDAVEKFFDAIEAGHWEEADALFKSLRASDTDCANPRDPALGKIWRTVQETWGIAGESQKWPADKLLEYGEAVLGSLRPGTVYVGGTDPGCFIPTMLNATSDGDQHIVFTQNALASSDYLDYLSSVYGDRMVTLTQDDSKQAFAKYLADYQKRLAHDRQFPDEPKQVLPREKITGVEPGVAIDPDKVNASGIDAVMVMNEHLLKLLMGKNPDLSFAMEVSFPFRSLNADAAPLGPILELRVQDPQNALTRERAAQSVDYWRTTAEKLGSGPDAADALFPRLAYAKMASEQAALFLDRGYAAEAEQTLRLANEIGPGNSEAFFRLVNLLVTQGRIDDALAVAEATYQSLPSAERLQSVYGDKSPAGPMRMAIEDLKRQQRMP